MTEPTRPQAAAFEVEETLAEADDQPRRLPRLRPLQVLATFAVATVGGTVAAWAGLPLPWMLGALFLSAAIAMAGAPLHVPLGLRTVMLSVMGVLMGSRFQPSFLTEAPTMIPTLAMLIVSTVLSALLRLALLSRLVRMDPVTAFFAAVPGGLSEMSLQAEARGGDVPRVVLMHVVRIVLTVAGIPIGFALLGISLGPRGSALDQLWTAPAALPGPLEAVLLAACLAAAPLARRLKIPAAHMAGPMVASAALHISGIVEAAPPALLVAAAQIIVGGSLGLRMGGLKLRSMGPSIAAAAAVTALLMATAAACAWVGAALSGTPYVTVFLAYAPGGLAEISLVALAMHADVPFVATHHLSRLMIVFGGAPLLFGLLTALRQRHARHAPPPP